LRRNAQSAFCAQGPCPVRPQTPGWRRSGEPRERVRLTEPAAEPACGTGPGASWSIRERRASLRGIIGVRSPAVNDKERSRQRRSEMTRDYGSRRLHRMAY
jgi:hypothetical protein